MILRRLAPLALLLILLLPRAQAQEMALATGGELRIAGGGAETCPLERTDVTASVDGALGRVKVRQVFRNPLDRKIEAVYGFPLPEGAAVDEMTMLVGDRRIRGVVKPREQARKTYEAAKRAGHVASLLDQERPNLFTQSVANIEPGATVEVEIGYVEVVRYEDGFYEWVFPTTVGPRYVPGASVPPQGRVPGTARVPDAERITPPVVERSGRDLSLTVRLDGGMPIQEVASPTHAVDVQRSAPQKATVTLAAGTTIPNKDFVLRYRLATDDIADALLVHRDPRGTFFTLLLQPPRRVEPSRAVPKEMIFVIDCSGSMEGFPLDKARRTMSLCIQKMNPHDSFNLISFAGGTGQCFPQSMPNTSTNRATALRYLDGLSGSGGTEMLPAAQLALGGTTPPGRTRIVCFMTDGYIGDDFELIDAVKKSVGKARVFSFGIGTSVNRSLLDGMASAGRGEVEYVLQESQAEGSAERFQRRIDAPVLTDVRIDWGTLPVRDVHPARIPDLFSHRPVLIHGRLEAPANGTIRLLGNTADGPFQREIRVPGPETREGVPSLWARARVKDLMGEDLAGVQSGQIRADLKEAITRLGVDFRLMTQYTSFVAVEERRVTRGPDGGRVDVPNDLPEGVSWEGVFGAEGALTAQVGDPLLQVEAPADAVQVVALMPGGETKSLRWNRKSGKWEARFDIPTYAREGEYRVRVILVTRDGRRQQLTLAYHVDMTRPAAKGRARWTPGATIRLELEASEDTARAVALLPWGERLDLQAVGRDRFASEVLVPKGWRAEGAGRVTCILTDQAHNRTSVTLDLTDL